ncbi:hypothetical protein [Ottowia sp.]|uniref:hypothetical protein n=1 Tax=Ottowia sp. TaxID=1898956 RepID=UPI0025E694CE|nr:hypothetical protein [Ottowia sp.]MBK6616271.1 hypothetical protein [Ottowia sp.]
MSTLVAEGAKAPSLSKQRAQAKARKRMAAIVASLQRYVAGYSEQPGYLDYLDRTLIDDMLFGLGKAMDPKGCCDAAGYEVFKRELQRHLQRTGQMPLAEVCAFRLPDGSRIERTNRGKQELWAVFKDGRVLDTGGKWQWSRVPARGDDAYLQTCRYASAELAYSAWQATWKASTDPARLPAGKSKAATKRGAERGGAALSA